MSKATARPDGLGYTDDAAQLAELGYESRFERRMGLWENFALGFTYLSPVVGVYSTFALAFMAGGPPMIWSIVIAGLGQLLVALVFAEIVAQFPVAGGVYPWARRLIGRRWAWITGWIYGWALIATVASVSHRRGAVHRLAVRLHADPDDDGDPRRGADGVRAAGQPERHQDARARGDGRLRGRADRRAVRRRSGCCCSSATTTSACSSTRSAPAATAATSARSWPPRCSACTCSTASRPAATSPRRSPIPGRTIPKAMRRTIYIGGFAGLLITAALILAQPDFNAILSRRGRRPGRRVLSRRLRQRRLEDHHRDRADQLRVLRALAAGRGEPADLLLRARPHGLRVATRSRASRPRATSRRSP